MNISLWPSTRLGSICSSSRGIQEVQVLGREYYDEKNLMDRSAIRYGHYHELSGFSLQEHSMQSKGKLIGHLH